MLTTACTQRDPNLDERAYKWAAVTSGSIEPCKKISEGAVSKYSFNPVGYKIESLRSQCFREVAMATRNKELCDFAVPVSRLRALLYDGSKYSPEDCRKKIEDKQRALPILLPGQAAKLMASLQYSDETIINECTNHFSIQRENIDEIKNRFIKRYDACVAREMQSGGGLERTRRVYEISDDRKKFCYQRELMHSGIKDHYFGKSAKSYPNDRKYGFCEDYCTLDEFKGYCQRRIDERVSEKVYIKYLESQARYGDLLQRLQLMPDYSSLTGAMAVNQTERLQEVSTPPSDEIKSLGVITNNVTDIGVDTNADGLFECIDVKFEVDIDSPGTYDLAAELKLGQNTLFKGTRLKLSQGLSTLSVSFSEKDIKKYLNGDGPYEISDVRLIRNANADLTQRTRMADRRADLGFTQAYQLQQLQRPLTVILDGVTESAVDTNGNGKFDVLRVVFQVDILQTGTYTWSGSVRQPDNRQAIATASSSGTLNDIGLNNLSLSFKGTAIGASGFNGPYIIGDFGIYGPPKAAALKLKMGKTAGYTCDQFEGFKGPCKKNLPDTGRIILKKRH